MKEKGSKKEKIGIIPFWSWNLRGMSVAVQTVLISYVTFYCTDVLGLNAGIVATLLMVSKLFDGVTDILAGYLIDITHTKLGKARPYELAVIGLWFCTWLMYSVPTGMQDIAKYAWAVICYTMAQSIFNTLLGANQTAYMVRAFNKQEHYVKLSSIGGLITVLGVIIFNVIFPSLVENAGTDPNAWSRMALMLAVPLGILGMMRFIFVPEKYEVDTTSEKLTLKDVKTLLTTNKYIYIIAMVSLVYNICSGLGVSVYYYTYIVGDLSMSGIMSIFSAVAMLSMVLYPVLLKKITTKQLIQIGCIMYVISGILNFVAYDNLILLAIASIIGGIGTLPISMMSSLLIIECADFNEWNNRPRMEGTLGSVNGFANKVGAALGTFICGILLSAAGYAGNLAVQPDSALTMIRLLFGIIPAVFYAVTAVVLHFYDLDKKITEIRSGLEQRRGVHQ